MKTKNTTLILAAAFLVLFNTNSAQAGFKDIFSGITKGSSKTVDNSILEITEKASSGVKYVMLTIEKDNGPINILADVNQGVYKFKLALQEGAGIYDVKIAENKSNDRYNNYYTVKKFSVDNTDRRDSSFALPSQKAQSDDPRIIELAKSVTKNARGEEEVFHAIYNYVTKNISYDTASVQDGSYIYKEYNALQALNDRKTICDGFSSLIAAMARVVGLKTKVVFGVAQISPTRSGRHAWNEVLINGHWKMVDATFDAGRKFQSYYNMDEDQFVAGHTKQQEMPF